MINVSRPFVAALAAALICGVLPCRSLEAGLVALHRGATDPTKEGWVQIGGNRDHTFSPVFNDQGTTDAWKIDTRSDGGDGKYHFYLEQDQVSDILTSGWSLQATVRLLDVGLPEGQFLIFRTGNYEYRLGFGTDSNGDPVVENTYVGGSVTVPNGAGMYHTYELRSTSRARAELYIDGTLAARRWAPYSYAITPAVVFGDVFGSRSIGGDANYAYVAFEAVPEPPSAWLVAVAAMALSAAQRFAVWAQPKQRA